VYKQNKMSILFSVNAKACLLYSVKAMTSQYIWWRCRGLG